MWMCPKCNTENSDWNKKCEKCQYKAPRDKVSIWKVLLTTGIIAAFASVILWLSMGFGVPEDSFPEDIVPVYVEISDPGIEKAIRRSLERPEGPIAEHELLDIHVLNAEYCGVKSFEDLVMMPNLQLLFLQGNGLTDVSGVTVLKDLLYINIDENEITDLSFIKEMPRLNELSANHNKISDLSPLAGETRFLRLYLAYNQITDITPLTDLRKLIHSSLEGNDIKDFTPMLNKPYLKDLLFGGKYWSGDNVQKLIDQMSAQ